MPLKVGRLVEWHKRWTECGRICYNSGWALLINESDDSSRCTILHEGEIHDVLRSQVRFWSESAFESEGGESSPN